MAQDFGDYIGFWEHNGYWLFDSPEALFDLAMRMQAKLQDLYLFYYEIYDCRYDEKEKTWKPFGPELAFTTKVKPPVVKQLAGYDVVSFWAQNRPECSPLSCNGLAESLPVNAHCLLNSLEETKQALEADLFEHSEPGPYGIFAVYRVDTPNSSILDRA